MYPPNNVFSFNFQNPTSIESTGPYFNENDRKCSCKCHKNDTTSKSFGEAASQTLSTGDIVITKIHFPEELDKKPCE